MSYSFTVHAATLAAAIALAAEKLDQAAEIQPPHARGKEAALANAEAIGALLGPQPEGQDVVLTMNGHLAWVVDGELTHASLGASVSYMPPPTEA